MVEGTEAFLEILGDKSVPAANDRWYRWAIGLSIWIAHEVRLDISSAIRILSHATGRNLPAHPVAHDSVSEGDRNVWFALWYSM